jgi:ATP adenylyltransferase
MAYVQGGEPAPEGCLFCLLRDLEDAQAHIVHRGQLSYVILNRFPYNNGHLMIAPYAHVGSLEDVDPEALIEMTVLTQTCLRVLKAAYDPEGFNVGANIGGVAGAGVADHVHLHIVPRWGGDTSFMTTIGHTRTIPEWIDQTFEHLQPLFARFSDEAAADAIQE